MLRTIFNRYTDTLLIIVTSHSHEHANFVWLRLAWFGSQNVDMWKGEVCTKLFEIKPALLNKPGLQIVRLGLVNAV